MQMRQGRIQLTPVQQENLSAAISEYMEKTGVSQNALARKANLAGLTIYRMKAKRDSRYMLSTLRDLALTMEIEPESILEHVRRPLKSTLPAIEQVRKETLRSAERPKRIYLTPDQQANLSATIIEYQTKMKMSQAILARKAKIGEMTVSRMKTQGKDGYLSTTLRDIALAMEIEPESIIEAVRRPLKSALSVVEHARKEALGYTERTKKIRLTAAQRANLAAAISEYLEKTGISQSALARKAKANKTTVSRMIRQKQDRYLSSTLRDLALEMEIEPESIIEAVRRPLKSVQPAVERAREEPLGPEERPTLKGLPPMIEPTPEEPRERKPLPMTLAIRIVAESDEGFVEPIAVLSNAGDIIDRLVIQWKRYAPGVLFYEFQNYLLVRTMAAPREMLYIFDRNRPLKEIPGASGDPPVGGGKS